MEQKPPSSVEIAIVSLQANSTPPGDRLNALRYLRNYVATDGVGDRALRLKINRLVLDNVLSMIMNEESLVDQRRRQYIRAECLLILSQILQTSNIFDDARKRIDDLSLVKQRDQNNEMDDDSVSTLSMSTNRKKRYDRTFTEKPLRPISPSSSMDTEEEFRLPKSGAKSPKSLGKSRRVIQSQTDGEFVGKSFWQSSDTSNIAGVT